jgi:hypothetical protein
MTNLTDASYKVDRIIDDLSVSMHREQVENIFSRHEINDKSERVKILRKCMQVLDTSNANGVLSADDEYSDELAIFLNGTWRFVI